MRRCSSAKGPAAGEAEAAKLVLRNHKSPSTGEQKLQLGGGEAEVMAGVEGHSRSSKQGGLEGECVGCNVSTLSRRPTRAGGIGGLGGWSEEEKVWNAF